MRVSVSIPGKLACMKKRTNQIGLLTDLNHRMTNGGFQIPNTARTKVGQLAILQVVPKPFIGIQIRRVRRRKLHLRPCAGLPDKLLNDFGTVNQGPVPKNNHPMTKMPLQMLQEAQDFFGSDTSILQHQIQTSATTDCGDGRKLGPRGSMPQDRRLAPGRPCPNAGRMQ